MRAGGDVEQGFRDATRTLGLEVKNHEAELALFDDVDKQEWDRKENFFGSLHLSHNGGLFGEIGSIWNRNRYGGAIVFFVVLFLNVRNLWKADTEILKQPKSDEIPLLAGLPFDVGHLMAYFELAGVAYYFAFIAYLCACIIVPHFFTHRQNNQDSCQYSRWRATAQLFKRVLPLLQSFSAMRVLQYVTPGVMVPNFQMLVKRAQKNHSDGKTIFVQCSLFLLTHFALLAFGFAAFLVKFSEAAAFLYVTEDSRNAIIKILLFLNQMLGVVQLGVFADNRLFQFIFGGVDNYMEQSEIFRRNVWEAGLQKKMWDSCNASHCPPVRYVALSVTFSSEDFQRLVLDEEGVSA